MAQENLAHLVVADFIRVASELGAPPSRDRYIGTKEQPPLGKYPKNVIVEVFGNWTALVRASGLQYSRGKLDRQEIRAEVFDHLKKESSERHPIAVPPQVYHHIFVWPDRHKPYHHPDTNAFLIALNRKYNFDLVIDVGDGEDFHAMSFHDTDEDLLSAGHELCAVIADNKELYREFPRVMICESNHSSLVFRKGKHHGFPRHVLKSYREILEAPEGWTWHHEIVVQLSNGKKCLFAHGYPGNNLLASKKRGMSLVQGHHHSLMSIQYWANAEGVHFAAQTGCLIHDASFAFAYNKLQLERPLLGCLRIENGIPHLLPMAIDKHGRWNGVVP